MKLNILSEIDGEFLLIELPESLELNDLKVYLETETNITKDNMNLYYNGILLEGYKRTLKELGIKDNELITLKKIEMNKMNTSQIDNNGKNTNIITSGTDEKTKRLNDQKDPFNNNFYLDTFNQIQKIQSDPENPENQAKILEMIHQEQINKNLKLAYDIIPQSFVTINMLYISMIINNHKVKAFVDSGAQATIISNSFANKIGVSRFIDRRFIGESRGLGTKKVDGKIHSLPIMIGDSKIEIPCSFLVIDIHENIIFGLDMLMRHRCIINLEKFKLIVGDSIETNFLLESEINSFL